MAQTVRDGVQRFDQDGVAVLSIDNPPINAINVTVRAALYRMLDTVEGDPRIVGVVIASAGRLFSGGGDLREIGQAAPAGGPTMTELAHRIETFTKPVAVAIRGRAIGGGVLMSLACHARLGAPDASIALPEVRLGFVSGAGGTQRLPRLVGIDPALEMIALAKSLDAPTARAAGFFDAIAERPEGLVEAAADRVRAIARGDRPWRRTSSLAVPVGDKDSPRRSADRYAGLAGEAFPGRRAPHAAIELVLSAVELEFAEGLMREREMFERLSTASETRALLHLFFARSALGRSEAPNDPPELSAPAAIRLVTSARRPHAGIVEIVCTGNVGEGQLQAACDEAKAKRRVPVVVRGGSIIERLDAAYRAAAEALEQQGFPRATINSAAAAEGLLPPFADAGPGPVAAEPRIAAGLLQAFVEEARACFAASMVANAGAIDIIAVEACGFPATRGGPLFYADTLKAAAHVQ